ncbi:hypothetical protein DL96DRAFT_1581885 [Flagelloscypha sp. PMI_526]|nr:hypothetical protein DL96DRAFT_1581885 [Flagelloscypha sp. PMI_526]
MAPQTSNHHLFSLPPELLENLITRTLTTPSPPPTSNPPAAEDKNSETPEETTSSAGKSCNICLGATFNDVDAQRSHFRSDWHRYNVKSRIKGAKAVSEEEFGHLLEGLEDSLSGSASSSSEDESSEEDDAVNSLVKKTRRLAPNSPEDDTAPTLLPLTAFVWFHTPPSTQLGIYRSIFNIGSGPDKYLSELKQLQHPGDEEGRTWALFMTAGGHFAGAIVRVSKSLEQRALEKEENEQRKAKKKQPKAFSEMEVLMHKTFHRYTTRRKQGGSQGLHDQGGKGKAVSAGAMLRRYGEQALRDDIRGLLEEWSEDLNGCERIWLRASGSNRKTFMDYEGAAIQKTDPRVRTFPFPTRRPTQAELNRCLLELTKVKISHFTEDDLREQDEAYIASLPKPKPAPSAAASAPAPAKDKPPTISKKKLSFVTNGRDFLTPSGEESVLRYLLVEKRADPTIGPAYDYAPSKRIRDVYREVAGEPQFAGWWDWFGKGHVPSVLNKEKEAEKEEKRKERRKGLKEKIKEREAAMAASTKVEEEAPRKEVVKKEKVPSEGPQRLGGASADAGGLAGLTPEMRAKIERERRARAAEARMKALGTS